MGASGLPIYPAGPDAPRLQFAQVELLLAGRAEWRTPDGAVIPCRLGALMRAALEEAKARGWVRSYTPTLENAWRAWCEARSLPCVAVRDSGDGAEIVLDLRRSKDPEAWAELLDRCREAVRTWAKRTTAGEGVLTVTAPASSGARVAEVLLETVARLGAAGRGA